MKRFKRGVVCSLVICLGLFGCQSPGEELSVGFSPEADVVTPRSGVTIVIEAEVTTRHDSVWISRSTRQMLDNTSAYAESATAVLWTPYTLTVTSVTTGTIVRTGTTIDVWIAGGQSGDLLSATSVRSDFIYGHSLLQEGDEYALTLVSIDGPPPPTSGCLSCPVLTNQAFAVPVDAHGSQFPSPLNLTAPGCQTWPNINTPYAAANWGQFDFRVPDIDPLIDPNVVNVPTKTFKLDASLGSANDDCDMATPVADAAFEWENLYYNNPLTAWNRINIDIEETTCNIDMEDEYNCVKEAVTSLPVPCPPNTCAAVGRTHVDAPWDSYEHEFFYVDTDIEINTIDFTFKWFPCHSADAPFTSNFDLAKLMAHEIGHSWGLLHRECGDEMMLPDGPPADMNVRNINEEEVRRVDLLYPYEGACPVWEWLEYENCWCDVNTGCLHI